MQLVEVTQVLPRSVVLVQCFAAGKTDGRQSNLIAMAGLPLKGVNGFKKVSS